MNPDGQPTVFANEKLKDNTTIVISGDHTIFRSVNEEFDTFAQKNDINMQTTKTFTPLIIYYRTFLKTSKLLTHVTKWIFTRRLCT